MAARRAGAEVGAAGKGELCFAHFVAHDTPWILAQMGERSDAILDAAEEGVGGAEARVAVTPSQHCACGDADRTLGMCLRSFRVLRCGGSSGKRSRAESRTLLYGAS